MDAYDFDFWFVDEIDDIDNDTTVIDLLDLDGEEIPY